MKTIVAIEYHIFHYVGALVHLIKSFRVIIRCLGSNLAYNDLYTLFVLKKIYLSLFILYQKEQDDSCGGQE